MLQPSSTQALLGDSSCSGAWAGGRGGELIPKLSELDPGTGNLASVRMDSWMVRRYADGDHFYALSNTINPGSVRLGTKGVGAHPVAGRFPEGGAAHLEARTVEGLNDSIGWLDYATFRVLLLKRDYPKRSVRSTA